MAEIGRLLTAMVTPFDDRGEVDYQQARRLTQALLDSGSDGVVVGGTTGESPTLSHDEKLRLFSEVKEALGGRGVVVAGTGTNDTAASVEMSKEAEKLGVDGLLLVVPYYNKPIQEGMYRHFEAIAKAVSLPCIMYNIPGRTGATMSVETTLRLAQIPNIAGVKDATGNLGYTAAVVEGAPDGFRIWSGNDGDTLPILGVGGYGVICVMSHLVGLQMKELIESFVGGRVDQAAKIHRRLLPLNDALMTLASNPIPIKHALNQIGFRVGPPRLPLCEPDEATGQKIVAEVRRHHIDLPVAV